MILIPPRFRHPAALVAASLLLAILVVLAALAVATSRREASAPAATSAMPISATPSGGSTAPDGPISLRSSSAKPSVID